MNNSAINNYMQTLSTGTAPANQPPILQKFVFSSKKAVENSMSGKNSPGGGNDKGVLSMNKLSTSPNNNKEAAANKSRT